MWPQSPEYHCPDYQNNAGKQPEYKGHAPVLPEQDIMYEALSLPLNDVEDRIELQQKVIGRGKHFEIPEDRSEIKTHLQDDGNKRTKVAKEDYHRRGNPGNADQQYNCAEKIIEYLD